MLSKRMSQLKASPTLALAAKARELKAQGHDVISLTVGEPDWPTYGKAKQAGIAAINEDKTTYTPASGIAELRSAVAKLSSEQLGIPVKATDVTVGSGAKFIIYTAFAAVLDPGEEVIIPSPYWVSYPTMVELAGGVAKIVDCPESNDFKLTAQQLKEAIGPKTKALLLNSPSNPTGAEYSKKELAELVAVLKENPQVLIISDDIYNQLSFTGEGLSPHILHVEPSLYDRCISINGMSKAYAMTGWRIGWAVGNEKIIKAMANFQSQTTGAPCSISQWASVTAILHCKEEVAESLENLQERRKFFENLLSEIPGMEVFSPQGAFYLWVNVKAWMNKTYKSTSISNSTVLSDLLLDEAKLAVVPGIEFGMDGYLRLSFAASKKDLQTATDRLKEFYSQLS